MTNNLYLCVVNPLIGIVMRRNISCILVATVALVLSGCGSKSDRAYDYEYYGLNTPVKSVKVTTYDAESKFGDVVKGDLAREGHYVAKFNDVGNLTSVASYDDDGELRGMDKYKYNGHDMLVEMSSYDDEGELNYQFVYEYDGERVATMTQANYWNDTEDVTRYDHTWDGEQLVAVDVVAGGTLVSRTKFSQNDESGSKWVTYDGDGNEVSRGSEKLNDGRIVKRTEGDHSIEVRWNDKKLPTYLKNAYLHHNALISWYYGDKEYSYYIEYEYDDSGNWVKQTIFEGEIRRPVSISERVITY